MQAGPENFICVPVGDDFNFDREILVGTTQLGCLETLAIIFQGSRNPVQHNTGSQFGKLVSLKQQFTCDLQWFRGISQPGMQVAGDFRRTGKNELLRVKFQVVKQRCTPEKTNQLRQHC